MIIPIRKTIIVILTGLVMTSFNCLAQDQVADTVWCTGWIYLQICKV